MLGTWEENRTGRNANINSTDPPYSIDEYKHPKGDKFPPYGTQPFSYYLRLLKVYDWVDWPNQFLAIIMTALCICCLVWCTLHNLDGFLCKMNLL